ncbi:MAG TPA: hypothetical protein VGK17_15735 [Propionicimonas sp.]
MTRTLSAAYGLAYEGVLGTVAADARIRPRERSPFWPMVGHEYDGDLLIVGRAMNGRIDRWDVGAPLDAAGASGPRTGHRGRWIPAPVIAVHPMTRSPYRVAEAVVDAFGEPR